MGSAVRISNYAAAGIAQLISMYAKPRGVLVALLPVVLGITPTTGALAATTLVRITGYNFEGVSGVTIGGNPCTSLIVGGGIITCSAPSGTGLAKDVVVTGPAGSTTLVGAFNYPPTGTVPVVLAVAPNVVDTLGGGGFVTVTVDSSVGCTGVTAGGVSFTSFSIVDATHVKGIPGAHAAGAVAVVVTNATGPSVTGGTPLEYWKPTQITGAVFFDAELGVTQVANAVSQWNDQGGGAVNATQATGANKPAWTASAFGSFHSLLFTRATPSFMSLTAQSVGGGGTGKVSWRAGIKSTDATATETQTSVEAANNVLGSPGGGGGPGGGMGGGGVAGNVYVNAYDGAAWQVASGGSNVNNGNPHIIGANVDGVAKTLKAFLDGAQVGSTATLGAGGFGDNSGFASIGAGFTNSDGFGGHIGWLLYTPNIISGSDDTKLTTWSRQRWGTP